MQTAIIGAGPTGLSAADHLGEGTVLLDKNASVGGWCRSVHDKGFTFDDAGHIMLSNDPYVLKLYDMLLGPNLHWQDREAWVYSKQVYTRYPFQGALYGLPSTVISECIVGAVEARFGAIGATAAIGATGVTGAGPSAAAPQCAVKPVDDCCADGSADVANTPTCAPRKRETQNFEEFIYQHRRQRCNRRNWHNRLHRDNRR